MGNVDFGRESSETENVKFRWPLCFVKDMKAGNVITEDCVRSVRPGYGLQPKKRYKAISEKVTRKVRQNNPVQPENFRKSLSNHLERIEEKTPNDSNENAKKYGSRESQRESIRRKRYV